jgi:hypothetical protein
MTLLRALIPLAAALTGAPAAAADIAAPAAAVRYSERQVWEYRTRPNERGSLLKIQRIEHTGQEQDPVYHISIIGLQLGTDTQRALPHAPVSRQTLDASVTRRSDSRADFPSAEEGIAEWRAANGGVFTITVAEIAAVVEEAMRRAREGN